MMTMECISCKKRKVVEWGEEFYKCVFCRVVFRKIIPTDNELENIYSEYYTQTNIVNNKTHMGSGSLPLINHAAYLMNIVDPGSRVLDFGAGTGELTKILIDAGYIVDGCEYSTDARNEARRKYGYNFYASSSEIEFEKYDLIIAIEVVEHLSNPLEECKKLNTLIKPKGLFYVTTPNTNGLQARIKKSNWREASKPFHLVLFNYYSINKLLKNAGFDRVQFIRFSPLTSNNFPQIVLHRVMQFLGLYGGLRVICRKN